MQRFIEHFDGKSFDLIVVGGGITGAAVAYDAALRGLSVALLEKEDFGHATSAATSKLIHGGLRYLANFEWAIVRESLRERRILGNIAPNLVYPLPVMLTCYNEDKANHFRVLKAAMILYDLLSLDKGLTWDKSKQIPLHRTISAATACKLEPVVRKKGLKGAHIYYDCASLNPDRLTLAFIKSAVRHGARVANYAKVTQCLFSGKDVTGVKVQDLINGKTHRINGTLTINCGGPWADEVLGFSMRGEKPKEMIRSEGIHLITRKLTHTHMVAYGKVDNSGFFMVPWRGHTLIGLTDKPYTGHPDQYKVTRESVLDLLQKVNNYLEKTDQLCVDDILFVYGGLRPLVGDAGNQDTRKMSRKYEIYDSADQGIGGFITVEGGKYTTSRNLAQHLLSIAEKKLAKTIAPCRTHRQHLAGCEIKNLPAFLTTAKARFRQHSAVNETTIDSLVRLYGTEYEKVIEMAEKDPALLAPINADGEILAQVVYALKMEMAQTLSDIVFRRTGIGTLGNPGRELIEKIGDMAATYLGWDKTYLAREVATTMKAFEIPT